jgi:predicted nucleic-acid-binding Zn-ribbon protein
MVDVDVPAHPSVDELREAILARGGNLTCPVCGREEFTMEEAQILGAGKQEGYGARRLKRVQLVCENCSHVMSFEVEKLRAGQ